MYFTSALALFLGLVAAAPTSPSAPQGVTIQAGTPLGSGCPPGSVEVVGDGTGNLFEVVFSTYEVQTGPGISPSDWFKNCLIPLTVQFDKGFQYVLDVQVCPYMHSNSFTNHAISGSPSSAPTCLATLRSQPE
jgi:hypothetical protein